MIPRGSFIRATLLFALVAAGAATLGSGASATATYGDNAKTIIVSLPGPFSGCSFLDPGATATSNAVLDLVRPSAFLTTASGNLVGQGGPIATAELTSLQPETVQYTITPKLEWSNGLDFNASDLVAWWQRARSLASVRSDGYRAIKSMSVSADGLTATAIFSTPYADWNLLFRDVEARGTTPGCAISNLARRPSLGPYLVVTASAKRVVLAMNPAWPADPTRFGHVVLTTDGAIPAKASTPFANYSLEVNRARIQAISAHPSVSSRIGTSNLVVQMTFAPQGPVTRSLALREALSWSLDRQAIVNGLWGAVTFSPSVGASALYAQGQNAYPGGGGSGPTSSTKTSTTSTSIVPGTNPGGLADCTACATAVFKAQGYSRTVAGWLNAHRVPLVVRLAVGPSWLDRATATAVSRQWRAQGVNTTLTYLTSEVAAAQLVSANRADVALFTKPVTTTASVPARSWSGVAYTDSFPGGFRSAAVNALFNQAISNFNPVAATTTWLKMDQAIQNDYWVRPLYTAPSLVVWGSAVAGVTGSLSIPGFVDQLTGWNSTSNSSK